MHIAIGRARAGGLSWLLCQSLELLIALLVGLADLVSHSLRYYYANWLADYMCLCLGTREHELREPTQGTSSLAGRHMVGAGTSTC